MGRGRWLCPLVAGFLTAGLWLPLATEARAQEPLVEGRLFSEWQQDLRALAPNVRQQAVRALGRFGPPALPLLIEALGDRDPNVQAAAVGTLGAIGPAAVPSLVKALEEAQDRRVQRLVAQALGGGGPRGQGAGPPPARRRA